MDSGEAELPSIVDVIAAELLETFDVAPRIAGLRAPYRVLREDFHDEVGRVLERHLQLETLLALAVSADRY